jgi:hypothetical protein
MKLRLFCTHPFQKVLLDALLVSCSDLHFGLLLSDLLKEARDLNEVCVCHDIADRSVWVAMDDQ